LLALALLVPAAGIPGTAAAIDLPPDFTNDVIVGTLDEPNSFAFLPDGRVLVTEQRTGNVRLLVDGAIAATDPVLVVPSLQTVGYERGLQGVAVDPAWPARPFVYLAYTRTGDRFRIVRYTASGDLTDPSGGNLALGSSLLLIDDILDETIYHQAGCLRFGPDGMLYASIGDDAFDCEAFDIGSLHGGILRLKVNALAPGGGPQVARSAITPPDNPFVTHPDPDARLLFAWGLRNPWRFQIDRLTGTIFGCDVGDDDFEEVNEIHAGDFMGWPYREANLIRVRSECPEPGGPGAVPYVAPIASYAHGLDSYAVISAGMYRPAIGGTHNWPSDYYPDRGDVFYADYFAGELRRLTWNGSSWQPAAPVAGQPNDSSWAAGLVTGVDFQVGPDGSLWWLAQYNESFDPASGSLNRIRFTGVTAVGEPAPRQGALRAAPNPFANRVELSFRLAAPEDVRLRVFDLGGRLVRTLFAGPAAAGETRVRWDGLDSRGRRQSAGVYFAHLERSGATPATSVRLLLGR